MTSEILRFSEKPVIDESIQEYEGVRCPPIFSLSNVINAGWLVRKCVNIYTSFNCWH